MAGQFDTVVAGSKAFALALFAPLTERVGTRPRIAADPNQAAALLPDAGLVVVELQSPGWLADVARLVASRPELRVVAALPKGAEAAAATLSAIGIESVPWTGAAAALLPAIDRALGREAVAAAPPPVAAAPLPAPPTARPEPALTPAPPAARAATIVPPAPPAARAATIVPPAPPPAVTPAPAIAPAARPAPSPRPAVAAAPAASAHFDATEFDVDEEPPAAGGDPFADPFAPPPARAAAPRAFTPDATWPANVPGLEVAEEALLAGMDRTPPPYPALAAVATQVAGALSAIEEKALARAPLGVDGTPIRRAAAMRVRVGFAFATAPPRGSASDPAAVASLLAEIDELLSEVNALAASSSLELAPALGACRNALVKEAIDFSEVAQRYVAGEPAALAARAPARPRPATTSARVVSGARAPRAAVEAGVRKSHVQVILLVLLLLGAAAYHGRNLLFGSEPVTGPPVFAGMPPNTVGIESADGAVRTLQARPGEKLDPEAVKKFIELEQAKGRVVVEGAPGYYVSTPAPPAPAK